MFDDIAQQISKEFKLGRKGRKLIEGVDLAIRDYRGGLWGVLDNFRAAGLGRIAATWVEGANLSSISPDDLEIGMGSDIVSGIAAHAGLTKQTSIAALTRIIPCVIDKMTPGGRYPDTPDGMSLPPMTIFVAHETLPSEVRAMVGAGASLSPPATPPRAEQTATVAGDGVEQGVVTEPSASAPTPVDPKAEKESEPGAIPAAPEDQSTSDVPTPQEAPEVPDVPAAPVVTEAPAVARPSAVNDQPSSLNDNPDMDTPHLNMPSGRIEPNMQILKGMVPVILIAVVVVFTAWRSCQIQPRASHPYGHQAER